MGWYETRWGVEESVRMLKSGMHIEDRKLRTADALKKCLAFDAVTALQMFSLARYARDAPDTPVEEVPTPGRPDSGRPGVGLGRATRSCGGPAPMWR